MNIIKRAGQKKEGKYCNKRVFDVFGVEVWSEQKYFHWSDLWVFIEKGSTFKTYFFLGLFITVDL